MSRRPIEESGNLLADYQKLIKIYTDKLFHFLEESDELCLNINKKLSTANRMSETNFTRICRLLLVDLLGWIRFHHD